MRSRAPAPRLAAALFAGCMAAFAPSPRLFAQPDPGEPPQLREADLERTLEQALDSGSYGFCRDSSHRLRPDEEPFCGFAEASSARCPAFRQACDRAHGSELKLGEPFLKVLAALIGGLLRLLGYVLVAAIVGLALVLVAVLVARTVAARRARRSDRALRAGADAPSNPEPVALGFERDADLHLGKARELAARGDYDAAVFELHLGVLLSLDGRGLIEARRGRSNGDYARDLSSHPELRSAFREVSRVAEAVQFGGRSATREAFENLLGRAAPLLGGLVLSLALAAQFACGGRGWARASDQCGTRADGHALFCELITAEIRPEPAEVHRRYRSLEELDDDVDVLFLLEMPLSDAQQEALDAWVSDGGLLLLSGAAPGFETPFGVRRSGPSCEKAQTEEGLTLLAFESAFESAELTAWATCSSGHVYIGHAPWGEGRVVFLPNSGVLSNASLVAADNARALAPLLSAIEGRVEIAGSWTGATAQNPLASLKAAGLLPWLSHLLVLGFVYALYRGAPFGRRRELRPTLRRRFSEHVQAFGERWAEARAARTALAAYASFALEVLAERMPSRGERRIGELASALARKTGRPEAHVVRTLARARLAREDAPAESEAEDLETLRDLGRLLEESGGPR